MRWLQTGPVAFDVAATESADIAADTRGAVRDRIHDGSLLPRCVRDIRALLLVPQPTSPGDDDGWLEPDTVKLWDDTGLELAGGKNYADYDWVDP